MTADRPLPEPSRKRDDGNPEWVLSAPGGVVLARVSLWRLKVQVAVYTDLSATQADTLGLMAMAAAERLRKLES